MASYEEFLTLVQRLPAAESSLIRNVEWVTISEVVGVARDSNQRVELFLRGAELRSGSKTIRDASEYRRIFRDDGTSFDATCLKLPEMGHYDQVAAFICIELIRNGADQDLELAYGNAEPIIELAIERLHLSGRVLVGLVGELLILDALCRGAIGSRVGEVVDSWDGWRKSSRDFTMDGIGVEVKTTTGTTSTHYIEGVHQIEASCEEDRLYLVSIGIQRADGTSSNSFTIPQLVERVISRLIANQVSDRTIQRFVQHVAEYGSETGNGYRHGVHASSPEYLIPFDVTFVRGYDMIDEGIQILRSQDIQAFRHVAEGSVQYRLDLSGFGPIRAGNPVEGANQVASAILGY